MDSSSGSSGRTVRGAVPLRSGRVLPAALAVRRCGAGRARYGGEVIRLPLAGEAGDHALWGASGSWVHGSAEGGLAWTGQPAVAATAERMDPMPPIPAPRPPGFSRRTLLAASAA